MRSWTRRDLSILPIGDQTCLVIACDSCGAIGVKEHDVLKLSPRYVGKFTTRVALTEVICSGAKPIAITNGTACEMNPTGIETILGIQEELKNADITDIILTGSTEENFPTSMTSLAITVIGTAKKNKLKFGHALKGDKLILLGTPVVGSEVNLNSTGFYPELSRILPLSAVKEIVPIGSKGVAYEAEMLASLSSTAFKLYETEIDYRKSAGPATCLLILCEASAVDKLLEHHPAGTVIGEILE